ncbi:hypothetical protein DB346_15810 [Verrucomicrobia bacterium LW23]|nr:hypothetical protein DB346_15810 [Verrucomicrobia bacterium LW23]
MARLLRRRNSRRHRQRPHGHRKTASRRPRPDPGNQIRLTRRDYRHCSRPRHLAQIHSPPCQRQRPRRRSPHHPPAPPRLAQKFPLPAPWRPRWRGRWQSWHGCEDLRSLDRPRRNGHLGWARIVSVESCPELKSGTGRVVTGTFTRLSNGIFKITVDGQSDPLHATGSHPLFSATRNTWVPVQQIVPGEELLTDAGKTRVVSATQMVGSQRVYNLEVDLDRCYYVGRVAILAHNNYVTRPNASTTPGRVINAGKMLPHEQAQAARIAHFTGGEFNGLNQRNMAGYDGTLLLPGATSPIKVSLKESGQIGKGDPRAIFKNAEAARNRADAAGVSDVTAFLSAPKTTVQAIEAYIANARPGGGFVSIPKPAGTIKEIYIKTSNGWIRIGP